MPAGGHSTPRPRVDVLSPAGFRGPVGSLKPRHPRPNFRSSDDYRPPRHGDAVSYQPDEIPDWFYLLFRPRAGGPGFLSPDCANSNWRMPATCTRTRVKNASATKCHMPMTPRARTSGSSSYARRCHWTRPPFAKRRRNAQAYRPGQTRGGNKRLGTRRPPAPNTRDCT